MSSIRQNSFWLLFSRLTAQGLAILFIALIARRLGVESFGQFTFVAALVLIGNTFTNFGTDTYIIRETARIGKITPLIPRALGLQLLLSALWWIVTLLLQSSPSLVIYSLALFPLAIFSVATATLRAFERMDLVWSLSLANGLIQFAAALLSFDLWTLCLFLLLGQIFTAVLSCWICSASLPNFRLLPFTDIRPLLRATLPFAALTILLVLSQRLGILTVSALVGDSATGIFSSVARVVDGLKLGHYAVLGALLPVISRGSRESKQSFRKGFLTLMGLSLLMAVGLSLFSRIIILILYGEKFISAISLLALLGWSLIPYTISSFISYDLIARGQENMLVKATALSLMVFLFLYLWLISTYNLIGAVYAALIGETMQAMVFALFQFKSVVERKQSNHRGISEMNNDNDPVLKPSELLAYRRGNGQLPDFPAPRVVIFAPQKSLADYVLRHHSTKRINGFLGEFHLLKRTNGQIALSTGFGIGAPVIAGLADEFVALGIQQFVLIGMAGGLQPELNTGSLVISTNAIRGEGVSQHYLPSHPTVDSSANMVHGLSETLTKHNHPHVLGTTWTTDAPFRELRKDVLEHQKQGVLAVDMEAAAMLSVAKSMNLSAVAVFSIADQLSGGEWRMAKDLRPAQKGLSILFDAAFEYLTGNI